MHQAPDLAQSFYIKGSLLLMRAEPWRLQLNRSMHRLKKSYWLWCLKFKVQPVHKGKRSICGERPQTLRNHSQETSDLRPKTPSTHVTRLQKYEIEIMYKLGKEMYVADALSRAHPKKLSKEACTEEIFKIFEDINMVEYYQFHKQGFWRLNRPVTKHTSCWRKLSLKSLCHTKRITCRSHEEASPVTHWSRRMPWI